MNMKIFSEFRRIMFSTFCHFQFQCLHFHITLFRQILKPNILESDEISWINLFYEFLINSSRSSWSLTWFSTGSKNSATWHKCVLNFVVFSGLQEFWPNSDLNSSSGSVPRLSDLSTKLKAGVRIPDDGLVVVARGGDGEPVRENGDRLHLGDMYAESGQTLQGSFSAVWKLKFSKY